MIKNNYTEPAMPSLDLTTQFGFHKFTNLFVISIIRERMLTSRVLYVTVLLQAPIALIHLPNLLETLLLISHDLLQ